VPPARVAVRRHPIVGTVFAAYLAGFFVYGLATSAGLTVPYVLMVGAGGYLVARLEPSSGFSTVVLVGLSLWGAGHLAGGIVGIGDDRTLYNAVIGGRLHFDNLVHFVGFGAAGLAWWEATRPWLIADGGHRLGVAIAVWLAGMGVGALNEVVEFIATLVLPDTNVGGYHNTGRDLIANMLGAAVAGVIAARRLAARESAKAVIA
jgi:hypothetical protein